MSTSSEHFENYDQFRTATIGPQGTQDVGVETKLEPRPGQLSQRPASRRPPLIYAAAIQPSEISWPRIFPPL